MGCPVRYPLEGERSPSDRAKLSDGSDVNMNNCSELACSRRPRAFAQTPREFPRSMGVGATSAPGRLRPLVFCARELATVEF